jgi:hypothetical protein
MDLPALHKSASTHVDSIKFTTDWFSIKTPLGLPVLPDVNKQ